MAIVSFGVLAVLFSYIVEKTTALQGGVSSRGISSVSNSLVSLNAAKEKKASSDKTNTKGVGLFYVKEQPLSHKKNGNTNDEEGQEEDGDNAGLKAAAVTGTTLAAARTATTISGGIAATTASVTSGSTTVGTTVSTLGAARTATTIVSSVAATTATVTSGTTTGTVATSGLVGAQIGTTIASGVGASSITAASGSSTLGMAGPAMAGARAATGIVGASALASGTGTSSTTAATSLVSSRVASAVGSGVGASVAGKSVSGLAVSGQVGASRAIPFFATTASSAAIKGGTTSRLVGAGAAVLASGDFDALSGGAIVVDAGTGSGFGEALVGAANEMLGDASAVVGDAILDGVSAVGSAVADAAIGVATDAAIGSGTIWGIWDGLHRVLPNWLFSGGAAVLGSEIAFALFALTMASGTWGNTESEPQHGGGHDAPAIEQESLFSKATMQNDASTVELLGAPEVPTKEIDTSGVLSQVELALKAAEEALEQRPTLEYPQVSFMIGDTVEIVGGKSFIGETAVVLTERGRGSGYWNLRLNCDTDQSAIYRKFSNLKLISVESGNLPGVRLDQKELAQRRLLEARIRYEIRYLPRDA
jgi:hypothetical protein